MQVRDLSGNALMRLAQYTQQLDGTYRGGIPSMPAMHAEGPDYYMCVDRLRKKVDTYLIYHARTMRQTDHASYGFGEWSSN